MKNKEPHISQIREEHLRLRMRNNAFVRRWVTVIFLGAIGFGIVLKNSYMVLLSIVLFELISNLNTGIRIDELELNQISWRND